MALKPLNSVGGFSVGEIPANVILANADITANKGTFVGNVAISNTNAAYGILTDNLYYSNGVPWDLQEAAGSNTEIQFNNNNDFGASANFTFNTATNLLTVVGNVQFNNANLGNLVTSNFANIASNTITNNLTVNLELAGNTANFSGNIKTLNANLGNLVTANFANFTNDLVVQGNIANANNINVTNTLNAVTGNFSGNVTSLNANLGNLAIANFANIASNTITNNFTVNLELQANTANFDGNVVMDNWLVVSNTANVGNLRTNNLLYANGVPWDLQEAAGNNNEIQFNLNDNFSASANFTFDPATSILAVNGNIDLGGTQQNKIVNLSNTGLEIRGGWNNAASTSVNIVAGDYNNNANWGKLAILGNVSGNAVGYSEANAFVFTNPGAGSGNIVKVDVLNNTASNTTSGAIQVAGGIGVTGNGYFGGNVVVIGDIANVSNISVTNNVNAVIGNFSGNINSLNANLGNLAQANFVNVASNLISNIVTVNLELAGNTANFSGNVILPNLTVNLELVGNTANFSGNVIAPNLIGALANGNSNVKVYGNSNVEISINGVANIATFVGNSLLVVGNIQSTAGNMLANGNVSANGFLVSANAQVTGEANLGSVLTSNITASGNLTITASGADKTISLVPTGTGVVDVNLKNIVQVAGPVNPNDAATKEYVDNTAKGLTIHAAVRVTSATNLNATYANGGSTQTTIAITGGKTIQFSAAHGLSVGDEISWTNSFNGITNNNPYFVFSTPAADTITVKDGYFGAEVTTLTNGTGLSQASRANSGVGATLTNAGANAAISIDGIALAATNRVLVQGQTNQFENGIYTVTTVGSGAAQWVLTRATDEDTYSPTDTTALGYGDYFFVQEGSSFAGSSYALTTPVGEILFGYTNIAFSQFSAAGSYTAGNGINITGTTISANVDNVTTAIVAGNIVVKTSADFTTPNLGDATFSSLTWNNLSNGNVTANNLSIGNIANISGNLTVAANLQVSYDIDSNANIYSNNSDVSHFLVVGANITGNNITSNHLITTTNANISSNLITSNATVNLELVGNTANFSGNVILPNLSVNLALVGNTANFSGNLTAANANLGNLVTANFANIASNVTTSNLTVNLELAGNTANFSGNIVAANANLGNLVTANFFTGTLANGTSNVAIPVVNGNVNITAGGNTSFVVTATGANVTGNLGVSGNFNVGNLVASNLTASTAVNIGNTVITWDDVTTSSITANQAISTISVAGITGIQWLVKGVDAAGSKYTVATVQAVTDGTSVDYATFGGVTLGSTTGTLAVNITSGNIELQVTPSSSNSTVWTTQYRYI